MGGDRATLEREWSELAKQLRHPSYELDGEDVAVLLHKWRQLRDAGHVFDEVLDALLMVLCAQVENGADDGDGDDADMMLAP
jgi:hypothetical protein